MSNTKMSIVVRRDLRMEPGLLAAQVLHIGMQFIQEEVKSLDLDGAGIDAHLIPIEAEWVKTPYVAVLAVDTPEELAYIAKLATDQGLPVNTWKDTIPSKVLEGQFLDCIVGISVGPADADAIKKATGTLPLYTT